MEIERKFLISELPADLPQYRFRRIEQAYLCSDPVVRVRREDDHYYMTYKGKGKMVREEHNLKLNREAYEHLKAKADGYLISKTRYLIPDGKFTIELDLFDPPFPLTMAEVEFTSEEEASVYTPPAWFGREVTMESGFHNNTMSRTGRVPV